MTRLLLVGATTAMLIAALVGGGAGASAEESASKWVTYLDQPSQAPAVPESLEMEEAAIAAATLVEEYPGHLLGSTFAETGTLIVTVSDDEGRTRATEALSDFPDVEIRESRFDFTEANDLSDQVKDLTASLSENVHTWGASPVNGGVLVQTQEPVGEEDQTAIEQFAEKNQVFISVETMPLSARPPTREITTLVHMLVAPRTNDATVTAPTTEASSRARPDTDT